MAAELLFPAMGTNVQLMACGVGPDALRDARRAIEDYESRWSRFLPESEVSEVNDRAGLWTRVSPDTFRLMQAAVTGWEITGGRFDPTVLRALVAAGYDRSFELMVATGVTKAAPTSSWVPGCGAIEFDERTGSVKIVEGAGIDLGGIAKGHTADLIVARLLAAGADGALANLGGDVRVAGEPPIAPAWRIRASNPVDGSTVATFALTDGAVVTTTRSRRHWSRDGVAMHHVIDPETALPSASTLLSVSVIASHGVWAEVLAKAAFVAGAEEGAEIITRFGATGILIDESGAVTDLPGVGAYLS